MTMKNERLTNANANKPFLNNNINLMLLVSF